jgi:hypothetical protein
MRLFAGQKLEPVKLLELIDPQLGRPALEFLFHRRAHVMLH